MSYFTRNMDKCSRLHSFLVTRYSKNLSLFWQIFEKFSNRKKLLGGDEKETFVSPPFIHLSHPRKKREDKKRKSGEGALVSALIPPLVLSFLSRSASALLGPPLCPSIPPPLPYWLSRPTRCISGNCAPPSSVRPSVRRTPAHTKKEAGGGNERPDNDG